MGKTDDHSDIIWKQIIVNRTRYTYPNACKKNIESFSGYKKALVLMKYFQ